MRLYIASYSAIRAKYSESWSTPTYPATIGFHVRFDNASESGVGFELFFTLGGVANSGLYYKLEGGGGVWNKVATAT